MSKPKTKTASPAPPLEIAENQQAAAAAWSIPVAVIKAAKAAGCRAFQGSRIHRAPLVDWIRRNAATADRATADDISKASKEELELIRLRAQTRVLVSKADALDRVSISKEEAKAGFARGVAIVEEEAQALMEPDHYRIFIDRCKTRIGNVIAD